MQEAKEHAQGMKIVCNMPYQTIYQDALWQTTYAIVWLIFFFLFPFLFKLMFCPSLSYNQL
jgi:hypothetical protein